MSQTNEPNKEFVDKLDWQLKSEFRRQSRFKALPVKSRNFRLLRATGLVLCSMLMGVVILKAVEHVQDSWKRELAFARAETSVELKEARLKMLTEIIQDMQKKSKQGLTGTEQLHYYRNMSNRMTLEIRRARLDLEEVGFTGQAPRHELYAPKIRGKDFVSERLQLEVATRKVELKFLAENLKNVKNRVDQGLVPQQEIEIFNNRLKQQQHIIEEIKFRLKLRREFLAGKFTPQEVSVKAKLAFARNHLQQVESQNRLINTRVKRMKSLEQKGMVSRRDLKPLEYELLASNAELRLARLELEILQKIDQ